jgi:hypothetical protein
MGRNAKTLRQGNVIYSSLNSGHRSLRLSFLAEAATRKGDVPFLRVNIISHARLVHQLDELTACRFRQSGLPADCAQHDFE